MFKLIEKYYLNNFSLYLLLRLPTITSEVNHGFGYPSLDVSRIKKPGRYRNIQSPSRSGLIGG